MLTVWHGTGSWAKQAFLDGPIRTTARDYLDGRKAFCVTTDLQVASMFALRRTSSDDFLAGRSGGVVIEFDLGGREGVDWERVDPPGLLHVESEVAVYHVHRLTLVRIHDVGSFARFARGPKECR